MAGQLSAWVVTAAFDRARGRAFGGAGSEGDSSPAAARTMRARAHHLHLFR